MIYSGAVEASFTGDFLACAEKGAVWTNLAVSDYVRLQAVELTISTNMTTIIRLDAMIVFD